MPHIVKHPNRAKFLTYALRPFVGLLLLGGVLSPLSAVADFEEGLLAAKRNDFETALVEWIPLAEAGDAEAMYAVAKLHQLNLIDQPKTNLIEKYFKEAAFAGYPESQAEYGKILLDDNASENDTLALRLLQNAFASDIPLAGRVLGEYYQRRDGFGEPRALRYLTMAASGNDSEAQYRLAVHMLSANTQDNSTEAIDLLCKSANQGHKQAILTLAEFYYEGYLVARNLQVVNALYERLDHKGFFLPNRPRLIFAKIQDGIRALFGMGSGDANHSCFSG